MARRAELEKSDLPEWEPCERHDVPEDRLTWLEDWITFQLEGASYARRYDAYLMSSVFRVTWTQAGIAYTRVVIHQEAERPDWAV